MNGKRFKGKAYNPNGEIIYELNKQKNGRIIEYDDYGNLLFDGEYLNGKRNGKGKEYDFGELIYEGEYLNDKRNGKGKEYNKSKTFIFEGEFYNDLKWTGTAYNNGGILYKLKNGKCNSIVELINDGSLFFKGQYVDGKRYGKGIEYYNKYYNFVGEYLNGKRHGIGKEYQYGKLIYEGEFLNDERNGKGKEYFDSELKYEGGFLNGKRHGKGKEYFVSEVTYAEGVKKISYEINEGKLIYDGEYLYGHKYKGKSYQNGKLEYEGEFLFDRKWNGKGYGEHGNIIYELNKGTGKVKEYHPNGHLKFDGEYLNGKKNGKGK